MELSDDLAEQDGSGDGDEGLEEKYAAEGEEGSKIPPQQTQRAGREEIERPQTPLQLTDDDTEKVDSVMKGQLDHGVSTTRDEGSSPKSRPRHTRQS